MTMNENVENNKAIKQEYEEYLEGQRNERESVWSQLSQNSVCHIKRCI